MEFKKKISNVSFGGNWSEELITEYEIVEPHQIPSVFRNGKGRCCGVDGLFNAQLRRRCAARVAKDHWHIAHVCERQRNGQYIVVVHGPNAIPSSDVNLIVEACAKGVCRPAISVHFEGDSVLCPSEMLIKDLTSHQMCGPSLQHGGPKQQHKACRSEKVQYVG